MGIGPDDEPWGTFIGILVFSFGFVLLLAVFPIKSDIIINTVTDFFVRGIEYLTQPPIGGFIVIAAFVIFGIMVLFVAVLVVKEGADILRNRPVFVFVFLSIYSGAIYIEYTDPTIIPLDMVEIVLAPPLGIPMVGIGLALLLSVVGTIYMIYEKFVWIKHWLVN